MNTKKIIALCLTSLLLFLPGCKNDKFGENLVRIVKGLTSFDDDYDSVADRWKKESVSDNAAANQAVKALLKSADEGDREAFEKNFTDELRNSPGFDKAVDEFFAIYPVGLSGCERKDHGVSGEGSYEYGHNTLYGNTYYYVTLNGEWYRVDLDFCYENTDHPEKVGVTRFTVMNKEATAVHTSAYSRDSDHFDDIYLLCDIRSSDEVDCRMIEGSPILWTPTDTPKLTGDEMRELLSSCRDLGTARNTIGDANAHLKYFNCTGYDYYYELQPVNGEPRYAYICTSNKYSSILYAYECSDKEDSMDYDNALCPWIKPT